MTDSGLDTWHTRTAFISSKAISVNCMHMVVPDFIATLLEGKLALYHQMLNSVFDN